MSDRVFTGATSTVEWRDDGAYVCVRDVGAAMIVVDANELVIDLTPTARRVLATLELPSQPGERIPQTLQAALQGAQLGEAIVWRPHGDSSTILGFTRYRLGEHHHLLLLREITEMQRAMSQRLHQQRLQEAGKLIAHITHDLRAPLASIVYNADVLGKRDLGTNQELVSEIQLAADNLRRTIAGLLAYVRLGPPVLATFTLRELCDRVSSLLRPVFRAGQHELSVALPADDVYIRANVLAIEQVLVNLLVNSMEASTRPARIGIRGEIVSGALGLRARPAVVVRVIDDGPGIPADRRASVFEAFITSKPNGTGLGLMLARETIDSIGGRIELEDTPIGCCFALTLPIARPEDAR